MLGIVVGCPSIYSTSYSPLFGRLTESIFFPFPLFKGDPQREALRPYTGDYPYHFKADAVGCKFLLTCSHLSAFLWITACGGSIAQTGPGHHETSPANSITRFTDGRIKTRTKLAWYGSSTTWTRRVTNGPSFPASAQSTVASPIPQATCPGIVYSSPGNCGRFPSPSSPIPSRLAQTRKLATERLQCGNARIIQAAQSS